MIHLSLKYQREDCKRFWSVKRAIIMAYKVIILYRLYMPSYFLGTFTEYP